MSETDDIMCREEFDEPPRTDNPDDGRRRVGVELGMAGLGPQEVAEEGCYRVGQARSQGELS